MSKVGQQFDRFSFFDGLEMEPVTQVNWSDYWRGVIPDGIVAEVGNEMRPYANSTGMYVYVETGACIVDNHRGVNSALKIMAVNTADATYDRIDLLVARVVYGNENESYMELDILTGTPAIDPVAPELTQSTGDVYEIALAEIYVAAEAVTLEASTVADLRNVFTAGNQSVSFINDDSVALTKGMMVWLSRDNEGSVKRCPKGKVPIGIVTSDSIPVGSRGQVATVPGRIVDIQCTEDAVQMGDGLIPSETDGIAKTGAGFIGGMALGAKEAGAVGNVKALLAVLSGKLPWQNAWWLPDGIEEDQCIAAYQFVDRPSEDEALININNGTSYPLTKTGNTVTWTSQKGFTMPSAWSAGLDNSALRGVIESSGISAGFGFSGVDISENNRTAGGLKISSNKYLLVRGWRSDLSATSTMLDYLVVGNATNTTVYRSATKYEKGVVTADWLSTPVLYKDGVLESLVTNNTMGSGLTNALGIFGQGASNMSTTYVLSFNVTAIVFYSVQLSAEQHMEIVANIKALGGIDD